MTTNKKTRTMKFVVGPDIVTHKGEPSLSRSKISLKLKLKVMRKEKQGILVECNVMEDYSVEEEEKEFMNEVSTFLQTYCEELSSSF